MTKQVTSYMYTTNNIYAGVELPATSITSVVISRHAQIDLMTLIFGLLSV